MKMEAIVSSEMFILSIKLYRFTSLKTTFTNLFRKDESARPRGRNSSPDGGKNFHFLMSSRPDKSWPHRDSNSDPSAVQPITNPYKTRGKIMCWIWGSRSSDCDEYGLKSRRHVPQQSLAFFPNYTAVQPRSSRCSSKILVSWACILIFGSWGRWQGDKMQECMRLRLMKKARSTPRILVRKSLKRLWVSYGFLY
jgi:hypothetical protein